MRVVVTGVSGKIGSATAHELADAGHEVVGIDRRMPPDDTPGSFKWNDLRDHWPTLAVSVDCSKSAAQPRLSFRTAALAEAKS